MPAPKRKSTPQVDTPANDAELRKLLKELERRRKYQAIDFFTPYPKQTQFFEQGATCRERLFKAGNQLGKTEAGAFEAACHLTGIYPQWWKGRRFDKPVKGWLAGETSLLARDVLQKKLCGEPGVEAAYGSGMIPRDSFSEKPSLARGITDAYDTIWVRHISGGTSVARFKSYEQGRAKFQGETLDFVWLDEEPDMKIYIECLTRITATNGLAYTTFTPLLGKTELVARFMDEASPDRGMVTMTIDDVTHISEEEKARTIAGYPAYMRDAKAYGIPMMGAGLVFQVSEELLREPAIRDVPSYWKKIWGIDFGVGHPFGAVLYAIDRDADCLHIVHAFRMVGKGDETKRPRDHAAAMKPWGTDIPVAWPRDGTNRESGSGEPLAKLYKAEGLKMLPVHATWPDGSISTEAGIEAMYDRMTTNRFKVASHLTDWWDEFRSYHRTDDGVGKIVKVGDDLMSASRVGLMMMRYAKITGKAAEEQAGISNQAKNVTFDIFASLALR